MVCWLFSLVFSATCCGPNCGGESFDDGVGGDWGAAFGTITGAPVCLSVVRYISDISEFGGDGGEISVIKILEISFFGFASVGWFAALSGRCEIRRMGNSSSWRKVDFRLKFMVSDVATCHKDELMIITVVKEMKFLLVDDLDDE